MQEQNGFAFDLLLRGGRVLIPAAGVDDTLDVAVRDGKVAAMGKGLPAGGAAKVADVSGCLVVPGLIDMHCHIYPKFPAARDGLPNINAEAHMLQSGVTTAVDAGTCGWRDFLHFKEEVVDPSPLRILAFVNIAAGGMVNLDGEQEPENFHPGVVAEVAKAFPRIVVGVKTAHYWVGLPFDARHTPWASVDSAVAAGEKCGLPVMADFQPNLPQRTYRELILKRLRPGDIHTHVYAQQFPLLDGEGKVCADMWQARRRGVVFDLGHGAGSFWFRNAVPALRQGFGPDTLSTDLYLDNVAGPVINLLHVLSKYLSMGMPLMEVLQRATVRPAQVLGRPGLGDLKVGGCADIAVLRLHQGSFGFADSGRASMRGDKMLSCVMTLRAGKVLFDPEGRGMPPWEQAPAAYWRAPGVLN